MTLHGNLLGPDPTLLPVDPAAAELDGGTDPAKVAAAHPTSAIAWGSAFAAPAAPDRGAERGADAGWDAPSRRRVVPGPDVGDDGGSD